jgi:DNA-binding HxlR family transcriptional regulator
MRFVQIAKMLTRCLQGLEAFGLVIRTEYEAVSPHVTYSLMDKYRELLPALEIINEWGRDLLQNHHGAKTLSDLRGARSMGRTKI